MPIGLTSNDAVTDSKTGRVLYVNSSAITQTGLSPVSVAGTYDLFGALIAVRDAINNPNNLSDADQMAQIDSATNALTEVTDRLTQASTTNGAQIQAMSSLKSSMTSRQAADSQETATKQDVDIVALASDLARRQVLYQAALQTASKLLSMSIFDSLPA